MQPAYLINNDSVVVVMDGKQYTASKSSHSTFDQIIQNIKEQKWGELPALFDIKTAIVDFTDGMVKIIDGALYYMDQPLHNSLTKRILDMFNQGFDIKPMTRFLVNLMKNPSRTAVQELYLFLETGNMPITEDGHFLAYKKVGSNFKDLYSGKFDNSVGKTVEVERNQVDDNRNNLCSYGLHFCSVEYLKHYGTSPSNKVVIVKIDPSCVVSIPSDYHNTKGRCSKYLVVGEYKDYGNGEYFDKPVYTKEDIWDDFGYEDNSDDVEIARLEDELDNLNRQIDNLSDEIDEIDEKIQQIEDAMESVSTPSLLDAMQREIDKYQSISDNLHDKITSLESKIDDVELELEKLHDF